MILVADLLEVAAVVPQAVLEGRSWGCREGELQRPFSTLHSRRDTRGILKATECKHKSRLAAVIPIGYKHKDTGIMVPE